jgi:hypothetical protein
MRFPHPIKSIQETLMTFAKAFASMADSIHRLTVAVEANTAALAAQLDTSRNIETAVRGILLASEYLHAAEKESRHRAGLRTELFQ